jgi:hypothetical protein
MENSNLILTAAERCRDEFERCIDLVDQEGQVDQEASKIDDRDRVEDQSVRFNIWAGTLGVFAGSHASLDYRLQESPDVTKLVIDQLDNLHKYLHRCKWTWMHRP